MRMITGTGPGVVLNEDIAPAQNPPIVKMHAASSKEDNDKVVKSYALMRAITGT
jgi:hypothetical protein